MDEWRNGAKDTVGIKSVNRVADNLDVDAFHRLLDLLWSNNPVLQEIFNSRPALGSKGFLHLALVRRRRLDVMWMRWVVWVESPNEVLR